MTCGAGAIGATQPRETTRERRGGERCSDRGAALALSGSAAVSLEAASSQGQDATDSEP
jgi:hypothetical protein